MCDHQSFRSACAYKPLNFSMTVKQLTKHHLEFLSLKRGCTGSSESTHIKMPHYWKPRRGSYVKFVLWLKHPIILIHIRNEDNVGIVKHFKPSSIFVLTVPRIISEYDQEIPQSQTADNPMAPRGRATQQPRDTRKTN